jgi:hypothetical protein
VVEVRRAPLAIEAGALYSDEIGSLYVGVSDGTVYPYGQPAVTRLPDGALRRVKLVDA